MEVLAVTFDHEQGRRLYDRLAVSAAGLEFNSPYYSDTYIDPVTHTLMLRPPQLNDAYWTSHTGANAKLAAGSLSFLTSGNWVANDPLNMGSATYFKTEVAGEWMRTASALGANRPVFLSFQNYAAGDRAVQIECGWSNTSATTGGTAIKFWTNGDLEVLEGGTVIFTGRVTCAPNVINNYLLIPSRGRELLIINIDDKSGVRVVFDSITEGSTTPIITPAEKFWVKSPSGSCNAAINPIIFPTTGYASSFQLSFNEGPASGATLETPYWFGVLSYPGTTTVTPTLRTHTDSGAFTPDGSLQKCIIRCTLTGDAAYTPFVEASEIAYPYVFDVTDAASAVTTGINQIHSIDLNVSQGAQGAVWNFGLFDPANSGITALDTMFNRPVQIKCGTTVLCEGLGSPGQITESPNDATFFQDYTVRDFNKELERYIFADRTSLRGYNLAQAIEFVLKQVIPTAQVDVESSTFVLGDVPPETAEDQAPMIEVGDTAQSWIERLHDDYASGREYGFQPTSSGWKYKSYKSSTIGSTAQVILYRSIEDAVTGLQVEGWSAGDAAALAPYRCFGEVSKQTFEPEANDVRVTGMDARTKRPLQAFKRNTTDCDPTIVVGSRSTSWIGQRLRVGIIDDQVGNQTEVNAMASELYTKATTLRKTIQFEADFPMKYSTTAAMTNGVPLWVNHRVHLKGEGIYAIRSMQGHFDIELTDATAANIALGAGPARTFTYTADWIAVEP